MLNPSWEREDSSRPIHFHFMVFHSVYIYELQEKINLCVHVKRHAFAIQICKIRGGWNNPTIFILISIMSSSIQEIRRYFASRTKVTIELNKIPIYKTASIDTNFASALPVEHHHHQATNMNEIRKKIDIQ